MKRVSPRSITACEEKMVMPRSRSIASVSRCESPLSTRPRVRICPASKSIASASVVLPASTCAKMPITACFIHFPSQSRFRCGHVAAKAARRGRCRVPAAIATSIAHGSRPRPSPPFHMPPIVAHRSVNTGVDAWQNVSSAYGFQMKQKVPFSRYHRRPKWDFLLHLAA